MSGPLEYTSGQKAIAAVAMSGGVDSSVAACLLQEQGYEVIGLTMRLFCYGSDKLSQKTCCNAQAIADARAVCEKIGAAHYILNFEKEFRQEVIEPFVASYLAGETPNPCVECNGRLKFNYLFNKARSLGAQYLATGHYVRLLASDNSTEPSPRLARGLDPAKDQSYFLWSIGRHCLPSLIFPLGEYRKQEVRQLAESRGLGVSRKIESQEICFVNEEGVEGFIRKFEESGQNATLSHPNLEPGPLVDTQGRLLGRHKGAAFYTVGQRRGLGVSLGRPAYVTGIDARTNTVRVGQPDDLLAGYLEAARVNYLVEPPSHPFHASVKVRYRHTAVPALVIPQGDGRARVELDEPQRAVTPGQSVVFYTDQIVVGGGIIGRVGQS